MSTGWIIAGLLLLAPWQEADKAKEKEREKKADEAVRVFQEAFKNPDALVRAEAVRTLSKTLHDKCLKVLITLLTRDDVLVRRDASQGLAAYVEPADLRDKAGAALLNAIQPNIKEEPVLVGIFAALGKVGSENTLPLIHRWFDNKKAAVAVGAVKAVMELRFKDSIDPLLVLLKGLERNKPPDDSQGKAPSSGYDQGSDRERYDKLIGPTRDAIHTIIGRTFDNTAELEKWWRLNKADFKVPPPKKIE